jgi:hypothetical protein
VSRECDLDRQQVVREEEARPDCRAHEPSEDEARREEQNPERIEHVVDVEAVTRPFVLPNARERSVHAVAEPVQDEEEHRNYETDGTSRCGPVTDTGSDHCEPAERGQVVGVNRRRQALCHPDEAALLDRCQ